MVTQTMTKVWRDLVQDKARHFRHNTRVARRDSKRQLNNMPDDTKTVKLPPIGATFRGPGPGRYQLPTTCSYLAHDFSKRRNPAYSFGTPHKHALTNECSPGPQYLPNAGITRNGMEGNPKYSLGGSDKSTVRTIFKTPGPGKLIFLCFFWVEFGVSARGCEGFLA